MELVSFCIIIYAHINELVAFIHFVYGKHNTYIVWPICVMMYVVGADVMWSILVSCSQSTDITCNFHQANVYRNLHRFLLWESVCQTAPDLSANSYDTDFKSHLIHMNT
jgi:hypothetical protein